MRQRVVHCRPGKGRAGGGAGGQGREYSLGAGPQVGIFSPAEAPSTDGDERLERWVGRFQSLQLGALGARVSPLPCSAFQPQHSSECTGKQALNGCSMAVALGWGCFQMVGGGTDTVTPPMAHPWSRAQASNPGEGARPQASHHSLDNSVSYWGAVTIFFLKAHLQASHHLLSALLHMLHLICLCIYLGEAVDDVGGEGGVYIPWPATRGTSRGLPQPAGAVAGVCHSRRAQWQGFATSGAERLVAHRRR